MLQELGISAGTAIIILIASYFIVKWAVKNGIKEAYQSSDIQLDLSVKNGKTIMHYYGKATTFAGKEENYDIETKLDFAINAKIK